jgi:hypothetical protein
MRSSSKPILCLDFDGVCHSYTSGWQGEGIIPDSPVEGLFEFLAEVTPVFEIHIFSTRSRTESGRRAMEDWFSRHYQEWLREKEKNTEFTLELHFPESKPPAFISLDDRALTFTGEWPGLEKLTLFKPWNKK